MTSDRARWVGRLVFSAAVVAAAILMSPGCRRGDNNSDARVEVLVHVGTVTRATLHSYVEVYGRVEPQPPGIDSPPARAIIGAPVSGLLARIECAEGERVGVGSTLFVLDSRAAEVAATRARTALAYAEKTLERQRELLEAGGTSERAVQDAEQLHDTAELQLAAAETQLELLRVTAPVAGTVVRIDAALGQPVEPNTILAEIIDLDRLVVEAGVPDREAQNVALGQRVEFVADGSIFGRVVFVGRKVDPATDTVVIRASVPADSTLRPGQFLEFRIVTDEHPDCLVVPVASVVTSEGEGSWVMVVSGDAAVRTPVTIGLREDGMVEVSGPEIAEGTVVITDDAYGLPVETRIRIAGS
ncbi:MAG: efflux RND transporter periplasmic adaptor subunit [Acidobacteria bacterium]|nr:efflux RND transporter periplasmic adaptor subunit [Acidobacteriota bacterium]